MRYSARAIQGGSYEKYESKAFSKGWSYGGSLNGRGGPSSREGETDQESTGQQLQERKDTTIQQRGRLRQPGLHRRRRLP